MDDYLALWSDLLTKPEATLSEQLVALTRDDVFAPLVGKQLLLAVHARELLGERISHALSAANLPTKTELAGEYVAAVPTMEAFTEQVANARSRTGELGEEWPEAATEIYTAIQLALTGQATPEEAFKQAAAG